jgi:hypothetical protein
MRCPYCDIAFSPAFKHLHGQYNYKNDIWSETFVQHCPECCEFIVGVYRHPSMKGVFITNDNIEEHLKLFVPNDHKRPEVKS